MGSVVSIHSDKLLGEREIGLMGDLKALDDSSDQVHSKFKSN